MALRAIAINCSLKRAETGKQSSTDTMLRLLAGEFQKHDVTLAETIRLASCDIHPGVSSNEGEGDEWPGIRRRILEADILVFGTPIWLGQMSSVAKRALERMDAFLGETDDRGRMPSFSKVAVAAIVGNEDGAHSVAASLFQALNDVRLDHPCKRRVLLGGRGHAQKPTSRTCPRCRKRWRVPRLCWQPMLPIWRDCSRRTRIGVADHPPD